MRCVLIIEYDGTDFCGWQRQPTAPSVQAHVEAALAEVAGHEVKTVCAGRTDAGVHALGQVVHFDTAVVRPQRAWRLGVNTHLPPSISVVWAGQAGDEFSARFSATERTYRYRILNRSSRGALEHRRAWCVPRPLDIGRMRAAAPLFIGEHDFSAFRAADCQAGTANRFVSAVDIEARGDRIAVQVSANAFLKNMVRIVTGVLVTIGAGEREPDWVRALLEHGDRTRGGATAPACGLSLVRVRYPAEFGIPMTTAG